MMDAMTPPFVDAGQIRRQAENGGYERGVAYFRAGAVRSVTWNPATSVVESVVDGSGPGAYRCRIRLDPARPEHPIVSTSCTCPINPCMARYFTTSINISNSEFWWCYSVTAEQK